MKENLMTGNEVIAIKKESKVKKLYNKFNLFLTGLMCTFLTSGLASAAGSNKAADDKVDDILEKALEYVGTGLRAVGIVMGFAGIVQLVLAFRNDDPEAKTKAGMLIGIAVAMIALPLGISTILSALK